jgi:hypothetical protein
MKTKIFKGTDWLTLLFNKYENGFFLFLNNDTKSRKVISSLNI